MHCFRVLISLLDLACPIVHKHRISRFQHVNVAMEPLHLQITNLHSFWESGNRNPHLRISQHEIRYEMLPRPAMSCHICSVVPYIISPSLVQSSAAWGKKA